MRFRRFAATRPEGPAPMTATFLPLRSGWFMRIKSSAKACSVMAASSSRFVVGSCSMRLSTHAFSQSAGQIRPVNSGKSFVAFSRRYASSQSPLNRASFHSGGLLPSGHAQWQNGTPQSMQRDACWRRSLLFRVCSTSPKSWMRSCIGRYPASLRGIVRNAFGLPII